ncbi:MAG: hypothetical protein WCE68_04050 [Anaerolineales bacterium]
MKKKLFIFVFVAAVLVLVAGCSSGTVVQINTPVPNAQAGTSAPNGQINVPGVSIQVSAPGSNPSVNTPDAQGRVAGIWLGIWHGFISPVTLVISFFNKGVQMYDVYNVGNMYNLGFFLGVAIVFIILGMIFSARR